MPKILSMPAGAGRPDNLFGIITNDTSTGYYLRDSSNTYYPIDQGLGFSTLTVPNAFVMSYVGSRNWNITASYDCTVSITSPATTVNVTAGTPATLNTPSYPTNINVTFI